MNHKFSILFASLLNLLLSLRVLNYLSNLNPTINPFGLSQKEDNIVIACCSSLDLRICKLTA